MATKTLVANPLAGLQGIPPRIILEKKSLTLKRGLLGRGKTVLYSQIESVEFSGIKSLTLAGTIYIHTYSDTLEGKGFYHHQYKTIKKVVEQGYLDDATANEPDPAVSDSTPASNVVAAPVVISKPPKAKGLLNSILGNDDNALSDEELEMQELEIEHKKKKMQIEIEEADQSRLQKVETVRDDIISRIEMEEEEYKDLKKAAKTDEEKKLVREKKKVVDDLIIKSIGKLGIELRSVDQMIKNLDFLGKYLHAQKATIKNAALEKYHSQLEMFKDVDSSHPLLKTYKKKYKEAKGGGFW